MKSIEGNTSINEKQASAAAQRRSECEKAQRQAHERRSGAVDIKTFHLAKMKSKPQQRRVAGERVQKRSGQEHARRRHDANLNPFTQAQIKTKPGSRNAAQEIPHILFKQTKPQYKIGPLLHIKARAFIYSLQDARASSWPNPRLRRA